MNSWSNKIASIITELQPHQKRALRKALKNNLLMAHSMGSGKTLTAIDQYLRTRSEEKEAIMQELKKALLKVNKE